MNNLSAIENIREQLLKPTMLRLTPAVEGYTAPEMWGVYRPEGGTPIGVVGNRFKPVDLNLVFDSFVGSVERSGLDLDLSELRYSEFKDGSKVAFSIPLPVKEIKGSPMVGDIVERRLEFRTGFDGLTKSTMTEYYRRVWCSNGCSSPHSTSIGLKNTINNTLKIYDLCSEIASTVQAGEEYLINLGKLAERKVTKKQLDKFIRELTGFGMDEYKDLNTRKQNILDAINESVAIEAKNTGMNMFSVYNGVTRWVTHDRAGEDEEAIIYNSTNDRYNQKALQLALAN